MEHIDKIKAHYNFTADDAKNLRDLSPVMAGYRDSFVDAFYNFIKNFDEAPRFLKDEATIRRHQEAIKGWFMGLFTGEYGIRYLRDLERVGTAHVKIDLHAHYVNAAMHFVKEFMRDVIKKEVKDEREAGYIGRSVEKIVDINLDVLTSSYIEEEKEFFVSQRVESYLIQMANRFSYGFNLILVLGLVILGGLVLWLFAYDLTHIFTGDIEKGLLSTLGSLLMLWVVIELMDTEIKHLKGAKFAVKIFVSVALVAVIRKVLVTSLEAEAVGAQASLIAAIAVLGGVYWLISKVE